MWECKYYHHYVCSEVRNGSLINSLSQYNPSMLELQSNFGIEGIQYQYSRIPQINCCKFSIKMKKEVHFSLNSSTVNSRKVL